ncbi:MAG: ATP-binding protein, partial [Bacteroidota bacterium]
MMKHTSPFKFLDAFTVRDRDEFFGRDTEVDALYGMVFRTPLTLVYGLSGTGKTSIIQCGLASRFEGPDWLPFFLRRNQNINDSLRDALLKDFSGAPPDTLPGIISALFDDYLRPVYLIFDQFEELFILGKEPEQKAFAENLRQLIDRKLPCRVILVIREEYLGQLYNLEKEIPTLFDHRLRIEPMSNARVGEVLQKSFAQFNIRPEAPAETLCDLIIENVSGGKSGIQLPYLQVYLDRLYQADYRRTFGEAAPAEALPELEFTRQEITDFGSIEGVLDDFVREQSEVLQRRLEAQFPGVPEKAVRSVLDAFVTEEGTKRPVFFIREQAWLLPDAGSLAHFPKLGAAALTFCFEKLEAARLLRITDNSIELAHDSLAALIDGQRSGEQRLLNEAKRRITAAFLEHEKSGVFLTERQLSGIEVFKPQLELDEREQVFLKNCYTNLERQKLEVKIGRLLEESKERNHKLQLMESELKSKRGARLMGITLGGMFLLASTFVSDDQQLFFIIIA